MLRLDQAYPADCADALRALGGRRTAWYWPWPLTYYYPSGLTPRDRQHIRAVPADNRVFVIIHPADLIIVGNAPIITS